MPKYFRELPVLLVCVPLLSVNNYSEFQVLTEILENVEVFARRRRCRRRWGYDNISTFSSKIAELKYSRLSSTAVLNGVLRVKQQDLVWILSVTKESKKGATKFFFLCKICRNNLVMNPNSL